MALLSSILCSLNRHDPLRRNVRWDGVCYRGECRHCGAEVVRRARKTWRKAEDSD
jgi:hypothetical protein